MTKKDNTERVNYWSVYWAINKQRIWKTPEFTDKNSGEHMSYEFVERLLHEKVELLLQDLSM